MFKKVLLGLIVTISAVYALNEPITACNKSHPDFNDFTCRKLRTPVAKLNRYLLKDYNKDTRPVQINNAIVPISIGLSLIDVLNLDATSQKLSVNVWLQLTWYDEFLRWDYEASNRQKDIKLPSGDIWTPDIKLFNGEDRTDGNEFDIPAVADSNGNVLWVLPKNYEVKCDVNLRFFPHDSHQCNLTFGSWVFNANEIDIKNLSTAVDTSYYTNNREWKVDSTSFQLLSKKYKCCPEQYKSISFTFNLTRNCSNYSILLIIPLVFLTLFSLLIFLFPIDAYSRIAFALLILLGFFGILFYIQSSIASASANVPLISIYCIVMIVILALAIIDLIILANLYSKSEKLPEFLRNGLCKSCIEGKSEENEWKSVAVCLDKLLFYVFAIIIILFVIIFLIVFAAL